MPSRRAGGLVWLLLTWGMVLVSGLAAVGIWWSQILQGRADRETKLECLTDPRQAHYSHGYSILFPQAILALAITGVLLACVVCLAGRRTARWSKALAGALIFVNLLVGVVASAILDDYHFPNGEVSSSMGEPCGFG